MGKTHVQGARPAGRNSLGSAWKQAFYQSVREAARALGITVSGVHRLRAPPPSLREAYPKGAPKSYGEYWADNKRFPIGFGGGVRRTEGARPRVTDRLVITVLMLRTGTFLQNILFIHKNTLLVASYRISGNLR